MVAPIVRLEIEENFIYAEGIIQDKIPFLKSVGDEYRNHNLPIKIASILRDYPKNYCEPICDFPSSIGTKERNVVRTSINRHNFGLN